MKKIVILGAGIAGIATGYYLKKHKIDSIIFEKNNSFGGLCDNFEINGFRFDKFVHLSFTNDEYVKNVFKESTKIIKHLPEALNYYKGYWLKHPAQNNLFPLEVNEKVAILKDFIKRENKDINDIKNYEEWLKIQYGNYFAEKFPMLYTEKYWTVHAKSLETKWIGNRMYQPNIEEVLKGSMSNDTPNTYYAKEMRYPIKGGYKSFLHNMSKKIKIELNKEVKKIDTRKKTIEFTDGIIETYDELISSIPLPEICKMIKEIPKEVITASKKLKWTSGIMLSIGFNKKDIPKNLWFYIYDKEILTARVYSPSIKSQDNVPSGCSSMQAEIYFSKYKKLNKSLELIMEEEIKKFISMGLFKNEDIIVKDIRVEKYANIIFDHEIYKNRKIVHDYLDSLNIKYIGRFGEWEYLWSDQSMLSGKKVAEEINNKYVNKNK